MKTAKYCGVSQKTTNSLFGTPAYVRIQSINQQQILYLHTSIERRSESIEATLRRRRILFAGFVARMENTTLPMCVMFGEVVGARIVWEARKKSGWGVSWTTSELSASTPTSERLKPRTRGNITERWIKRWNLSWRNKSLRRKSRLDYGKQSYART